MPPPLLASGNVAIPAALTFTVSVCVDDFEYSIACRQRSSLEAARRLEQIYLDDYATGSPGGSLRIWFAVKAEPSEQTNFLREVENRAVEAVFRKLREDAAHRMAAAGASAASGGGAADAAREFTQDIQRWHDGQPRGPHRDKLVARLARAIAQLQARTSAARSGADRQPQQTKHRRGLGRARSRCGIALLTRKPNEGSLFGGHTNDARQHGCGSGRSARRLVPGLPAPSRARPGRARLLATAPVCR